MSTPPGRDIVRRAARSRPILRIVAAETTRIYLNATLAGRYVDFWTLTERALDFALAPVPSADKALKPKLLELPDAL